jgi:hypothetical protein
MRQPRTRQRQAKVVEIERKKSEILSALGLVCLFVCLMGAWFLIVNRPTAKSR